MREWCERRVDCDTPETLVDDTAARYGLIHATDDAGAARAARQLLDEYKEVIGKEPREAVLAKLPLASLLAPQQADTVDALTPPPSSV